ncbi:MAG TPA: carboxypeptidase-like regulatory domain-containing protein [Pyrinomonadaceae bacterium]|jgi:hypothetical protein
MKSAKNILNIVFCLCAFAAMFLAAAPLEAQAAVSVVNSSVTGSFSNAGTIAPLQFSYTIGNGTNRAVYVGVSTYSINGVPGTSPRVAAVTFDNGNMIPIVLDSVGFQVCPQPPVTVPPALGPRCSSELFRLTEAQIGAATSGTFTVAFATGAVINYAVAGAITFAGVDQNTPNDAYVSNSGRSSTASVSVPGVGAGDMVLDVLGITFEAGTAFVNPDGDQVERWNGVTIFGNNSIGAGGTKTGTGTVNVGWLFQPEDWALGAIAVNGASVVTAASVTIGGRVITPNGRGLGKAQVVLVEADGTVRYAVTNSFGYYRFADVPAGQSATLEVRSKRYGFAPQVINVNEEMSNLNFIAQP